MVGPGQRTVERQMLLEHGGAAGHGGQRDLDPQRVIGEPDRAPEARAQGVHRPEVGVLDRRRVGAHAVQDGQRRVAGGADGLHRGRDLVQRRHAGREQDRAALGGDVAQQRQVGDLAGRHLEGRRRARRADPRWPRRRAWRRTRGRARRHDRAAWRGRPNPARAAPASPAGSRRRRSSPPGSGPWAPPRSRARRSGTSGTSPRRRRRRRPRRPGAARGRDRRCG